MGEFRSISGNMAGEGHFSRTTEKPSHQSKVFGWNVSQREDVFDRFATLILLICVLSINYPWK